MRPIDTKLLAKIKEQNQTIYNKANPKMSISVARAKSTVMDSTYWTVETIREKEGLGDISVAPRRFKPNGTPNRIYEIHVDNGIVGTAIREYPDRLKDGWQDQFSLGTGSSVAMAFNGEWQRYRKLFRLITEEKPYVSWVDGSGDLWVQKWDEHDTKFQLSSGVSKVKMIRAWKNTVIHYLEQGIVVAYIKTDGKVYYRNYCIQEDYTEIWEYEKELTDFTGTAVNVNLFITNDYRMGFVIEDSLGQVHWLVTPRNWSGMAIAPEKLTASMLDPIVAVTPIKYWDTVHDEYINGTMNEAIVDVCPPTYTASNVVTTLAKRTDAHTIKLVFNYSLYNVAGQLSRFSVEGKTVTAIAVGDNDKEIILTVAEDLPSVGVFNVSYAKQYEGIRVIITNYCFPRLESFTVAAQGDPPEYNEYITVGLTNPVVTRTTIAYLEGHHIDNQGIVSGSLTIPVVVITKVGVNPL